MVTVWNGTLDRQRQLEARAGVPVKRRCTFSLIGDTGLQGTSELDRYIDRSTDDGDRDVRDGGPNGA